MTTKPTNTSISISINGNQHIITEGASVAQAIALLNTGKTNDTDSNSFVIALNQIFVPRSQYENTILQTDDDIELLSPMAGG
jgi:thiamine biosynthesis protein ThiS